MKRWSSFSIVITVFKTDFVAMIEETNVMKQLDVESQHAHILQNPLSEYRNAWTALCNHSLSPFSPLFLIFASHHVHMQ